MRTARLKASAEGLAGYYHCVSRVVDRRFVLGEVEKEHFTALMRECEEFCEVRVLTHCILSNHFHLLLAVPPRPARLPSAEEVLEKLRKLSGHQNVGAVEQRFAMYRRARDEAGEAAYLATFHARMWDLSAFMKLLKQRFTQWYNGRNARKGTLWEDRFKSVLVEGAGRAMSAMAAYIDLTPVRAGLVEDPKDYRWGGYGEAMAGKRLAREGLRRVVEALGQGGRGSGSGREVLECCRMHLSHQGSEEREAVLQVLGRKGRLPLGSYVRCRVRYFCDRAALGSRGQGRGMPVTPHLRTAYCSRMRSRVHACRSGRITLGIFACLVLTACVTPPAASLQRHEFGRTEMGMEFRIVLYAGTTNAATLAATEAFDRIHALNMIFSDYEEDSELSRLSRSSGTGRAVPVSPELWEVLERSQELAVRTGGAFDVTVGPYVSLWRRARRRHELPRPGLMAIERERVGYAKLLLDPNGRTALLEVPRMRLDLGGIAKGYAMDEALKVLARHGISSALVTGGGDMALGEPPPDRAGWQIMLASLDTEDAPPVENVLLARCSVATSGDLYQFVVIDGRRYSHIVDPRTGVGLTDRSLVTVIAPDSMTADSLATAVSVLGPDEGLALVAEYAGTAVRLLRRPRDAVEVHESPGFKSRLSQP